MQVRRNDVGSFTPIYLLSIVVYSLNVISIVSSFLSSKVTVYGVIAVMLDVGIILLFAKALKDSRIKGIKNAKYLVLYFSVRLIEFLINVTISYCTSIMNTQGSVDIIGYIIIGAIRSVIMVILYLLPVLCVSHYFKKPSKISKVFCIMSVLLSMVMNVISFASLVWAHLEAYSEFVSIYSVAEFVINFVINVLVLRIVVKAYSITEDLNCSVAGSTEDRNVIDEVQFLKSQLDNGVISQEEFDAKKKNLLDL